MTGADSLAELAAMARSLGRELAVEEHGLYLVGSGASDDTRLGATDADARITMTRMIDRQRKAAALRTAKS